MQSALDGAKDNGSRKIKVFFAVSTCEGRDIVADKIAHLPGVCSYEL